MSDVYCGIDWAEDHHDIALVDRDGRLLARRRIGDDAAGLTSLLALLAEHGDSARGPDPGGDRDPAGAAGRLPARHRTAGVPDQPDGRGPLPRPALDRRAQVRPRRRRRAGQHPAHRRWHAHRPLPADSELVQAIAVLPAPSRTPSGNAPPRTTSCAPTCASTTPASSPRSPQRAAGISRPEARAVLAAAPTPAAAAKLTQTQLQTRAATRRPQPRHRPPRPPGCATNCGVHRCANSPGSNRPWAARPWPCSASSTPPAPPPTTSRQPSSKRSSSTPTPRSSPASPGSAP